MLNYIYALCDPETNEVRYIGKSDDPDRRYIQHLSHRSNTWKWNWIQALKKKSTKPKLLILQEVLYEEWEEAERYWISHYKDLGARLTNRTDGGVGVDGLDFDSRSRISCCQRARHKKNGASLTPIADDYCKIEWINDEQRWCAWLTLNDELILIGKFHSKGDAVVAYDDMAENVYTLPTFMNMREDVSNKHKKLFSSTIEKKPILR